jgi:HSP20 family protein
MAMEEWSPFRDALSLRDAMDRLFQSSFVSPRGLLGGQGGMTTGMPLDVIENDNGYQIEASLPGVSPEDVQITVRGDTLTIRGEVTKEQTVAPPMAGQQGQTQQGKQQMQGEQRHHEQTLARERFHGTYLRQVTLPTTVNADKAQAHFKDGILYLTLPKAEEAKPRQIRVTAEGQEVHHIPTSAEQRQAEGKAQHGH